MPEIIPGYDTQQKVVTVANNDTAINNEITTQAVDGWTVVFLTVSGSDMVITFSRNLPIEEV